jgi:hypothetical protein
MFMYMYMSELSRCGCNRSVIRFNCNTDWNQSNYCNHCAWLQPEL